MNLVQTAGRIKRSINIHTSEIQPLTLKKPLGNNRATNQISKLHLDSTKKRISHQIQIDRVINKITTQ